MRFALCLFNRFLSGATTQHTKQDGDPDRSSAIDLQTLLVSYPKDRRQLPCSNIGVTELLLSNYVLSRVIVDVVDVVLGDYQVL
jgi:hypothetical protein